MNAPRNLWAVRPSFLKRLAVAISRAQAPELPPFPAGDDAHAWTLADHKAIHTWAADGLRAYLNLAFQRPLTPDELFGARGLMVTMEQSAEELHRGAAGG